MKATRGYFHHARSPRWLGHPSGYQAAAQRAFAIHYDRSIAPWSWVTTECEFSGDCLEPTCMTVRKPRWIKYPAGVCVYCGNPAGSRDHLLPKNITGLALRGSVPVVPACGNCNSRINDYPSASVAERRRKAQVSIERSNRRLLLSPHKTNRDLMELGPTLRSVAIRNNHKRESIRLRLAWPEDPYYDLRAFQLSGVDDPVGLGLCDAFAKPLRPEYAA